VCNTADSDTPTLNGTTKFTTGGAYTELNKKQNVTLATPITINGTQECTIESALCGLNTYTSCVCGDLSTHICDVCNPDNVTATHVGLGNVGNVGTDTCVTQGSTNKVTSDAVYTAICNAISCVGTVTICDSCDNCDIPLALCTDVTSVGKSICCSLTYNPTTGVLSATCFCGSLDGLVTNATCVCVECVCNNVDYKVALVNELEEGVCPHQTAKYSSDISYNPTTGVLSADYFCGTFCGSITCADKANYSDKTLCVYVSQPNCDSVFDVALISEYRDMYGIIAKDYNTKIKYNPYNGTLYVPKIQLSYAVDIQYNADTEAIEFVF
jgi:hypothetical protein